MKFRSKIFQAIHTIGRASTFVLLAIFGMMLFHASCTTSELKEKTTMLELLDSEETGIFFSNDISEDLTNNVFTYTNFYNGGGVAIGDVDNDGLVDIYFSANSNTGKLYRNMGNFKFEDITPGSGMDTIPGWKTGVTMVDINQDGYLDIYMCRSGRVKPKYRKNLLFINNGDLTFTEKSEAFGLDDWSTSLHSAFFDYDLDGDLDMYLLNHAMDPVRQVFRNFHDDDIDRFTGDKLYRNEGGKYIEVKEFIGLKRSKLGDGLGLAVSDFNDDLFPDIYISNDFAGRDYLYFNQGDGTFTETALESMEHISYSSMGVDAADIDNDGWQDVFVLDMQSSTNYGRKTNMASMDAEVFNVLVDLNGHHQYMRNTLQLNNGNQTFSDIAPMAGVESTDWSWSPLFVDLDNDGYKDLFVTNGMRKNMNNKDYQSYRDERIEMESKKPNPDYERMMREILDKIPAEKSVNMVFRNKKGVEFENYNTSWGIETPSFSNGCAYVDLDNDGDMDLVVNNIDDEAHIYRNNAYGKNTNHFVKIKLLGPEGNRNGIGAKLKVKTGTLEQYKEQQVSRGYQSNVDFVLHFGLGKANLVDVLQVIWPDGKVNRITNVQVDGVVEVDYENAETIIPDTVKKKLLFTDVTELSDIAYRHTENQYDDFKKELLLPHKMSTFGPALAVGDVNKDGLEDFFVGGAKDQSGAIYLQETNQTFRKSNQKALFLDKFHEDVDASFFDADQDGDIDLYVVSGGNELPAGDTYYQDRLYLNNGKGNFYKVSNALPVMNTSGGVVSPNDVDGDGDIDLFIGGRLTPGQYPKSDRSYLLLNENGKFKDVTQKSEGLINPGMITDALWSDYDSDGQKDLILVGEWMPITIFKNGNGTLTRLKEDDTLKETHGWWFSISEGDVNSDGRMDYILGNLGENYKYKATPENPFRLYSKDFDNNGSLDIVLSYFENDTLYPLRGKQCSSDQIPGLKDKFKNYGSFGASSLEDIYSKDSLQNSELYEAKTFSTSLLLNFEDGFTMKKLPKMAQVSAVFGIVYEDFDNDDHTDLLLAGNLYNSEVETPRGDASSGLFLRGDGKGNFKEVRGYDSGLFIPGDIKKLEFIRLGTSNTSRKGIISSENNGIVRLHVTK